MLMVEEIAREHATLTIYDENVTINVLVQLLLQTAKFTGVCIKGFLW